MWIRDANILRGQLERCLQMLDKHKGREESALAQCITVIINEIEALPEVEVIPVEERAMSKPVEVVRCKDCVYSEAAPWAGRGFVQCLYHSHATEINGYCYKGEHKNGGADE